MPSIKVPSSLRRFTANKSDVETTGTTVAEALAELEKLHPGIGSRIFDGKGGVKPFIKIFVGAEDIGGLQGLETKVGEKDEMSIVPAIAGG